MTASDASDDHEVPPRHRRRPRSVGTHPRRFGEKYKELAPERCPELTEHVRGRGRTPAGQHVPIMVEEVLAAQWLASVSVEKLSGVLTDNAAFRRGAREGVWAAVSDEIIRASKAEQRDNPRSSAAKLRWAHRA